MPKNVDIEAGDTKRLSSFATKQIGSESDDQTLATGEWNVAQ
jgi:hypothetical protein